MGRGSLNNAVQEAAIKHIGREISVRELRLLPYIQYTMINEQKLKPNQINQEERNILNVWRKGGYIEGGASEMRITKEFWNFMCEVLFYSYVDY